MGEDTAPDDDQPAQWVSPEAQSGAQRIAGGGAEFVDGGGGGYQQDDAAATLVGGSIVERTRSTVEGLDGAPPGDQADALEALHSDLAGELESDGSVASEVSNEEPGW